MKITKSQLKQIIKEEIESTLNEGLMDFLGFGSKEKHDLSAFVDAVRRGPSWPRRPDGVFRDLTELYQVSLDSIKTELVPLLLNPKKGTDDATEWLKNHEPFLNGVARRYFLYPGYDGYDEIPGPLMKIIRKNRLKGASASGKGGKSIESVMKKYPELKQLGEVLAGPYMEVVFNALYPEYNTPEKQFKRVFRQHSAHNVLLSDAHVITLALWRNIELGTKRGTASPTYLSRYATADKLKNMYDEVQVIKSLMRQTGLDTKQPDYFKFLERWDPNKIVNDIRK